MKTVTLTMAAWLITLGIYALLCKAAIWALYSAGGPVLPFMPVFIGVIVLRILFGRRG
jgi:hypothetical protein